MVNPSVSVVNVSDTATLIASAPGKYLFTVTSGSVVFGDASVVFGTSATQFALPTGNVPMVFEADCGVYAICNTGQSGSVKVVRWI